MYEQLYFITSLIASVVALSLAIVLAGLQVNGQDGYQKYDKARWFLAGAFAAFGILSAVEILVSGDVGSGVGELSKCLVIVIGSLMAMFVTMTVLSFIRPQIVTRKNILLQLAVIIPAGLIVIAMRAFASPLVFNICIAVMVAAYLLQMAFYTRVFLRSYRQFKERMLAFYEEEDLVGQLHWINKTFWLALATGVAALVMLFENRLSDSILTILFAVAFLLICIFFINYRGYAPIVDRAVAHEHEPMPLGKGKHLENKDLQAKIDKWVLQKGYLDSNKSVGDIAQEMGWYYQALKDYIQQTTGEDFRSWRLRLRIQEAQRLLAGQPALPISRIVTLSGFNDRAHFYRCFQRITGCSPQEYRKSLQDSQ